MEGYHLSRPRSWLTWQCGDAIGKQRESQNIARRVGPHKSGVGLEGKTQPLPTVSKGDSADNINEVAITTEKTGIQVEGEERSDQRHTD